MKVGVVKEVKADENRVALTPAGVEAFCDRGHSILVEAGAGEGSGFSNEEYAEAGAAILGSAGEVWSTAEMVLKVKEPQMSEFGHIRENQIVFTYFHFAASEELTRAIIETKCIAIAYETIVDNKGQLPLLTPMSEVAGRMAVQQGAKYLEKAHGGRGILLGGVPGVPPATVVVLGAGVVGMNATKMAAGLGSLVYVLDVNLERLRYYSDVMPSNVITMMSNKANLRKTLADADLVVSSVLIPGGKAPKLITKETLKIMKPGAVIVDVAIDQGGSTETSRPTTHRDPIYTVDGIVHYCVTNMPGAMPMTSTMALTNATIRYALELADKGFAAAIRQHKSIAMGANIVRGTITHHGVAEAFGLPYEPVYEVLKG
ncbi:alanine dehydrogenase [Puniceicoccales bacterium CK1056]|uniref:Alanine dehydrogenase n=1 Tax=Oceanipulchritudo coccoides TaxID=2706888 RepID=A0A6B2M5K2_9BACT|nr:alanine dehydrogenase [Oceanipulchritudo coccoides]NDV63449.1 alanine dehydrogenase [Oceanipulchritudo coccoides]